MGLGEDKKVVLEKYGPYVRSLAATVRKQFTAQLELDELIAYGQIGLLEAADRFDPKVGANFLTFAHYRIKGAIFDGLRKMGVLQGLGRARAPTRASAPRRTWGIFRIASRAEATAGGPLTMMSWTSPMRWPGWRWCSRPASKGRRRWGSRTSPCRRISGWSWSSRRRGCGRRIEKLPEKERQLLQGYYFQGKTLEEAGAEIGQSKSWASRLHARAIERLKEF